MAFLKYFERVHALLDEDRQTAGHPLAPFDFESLGTKSAFKRTATRFLLRRVLPVIFFILRQVWPNPRFGRFVGVTRADDVAQVLGDMEHFRIVYAPEMLDLGGGAKNILAADDAEHDAMRAILHAALRPDDFAAIGKGTAEDAEALLAAGGGRIDIFRDLITRTASEAACRYFGLTAHDPDRFGQWTMAVSNQIFGDYEGDANVHRQAKIASAHLCGLIDDAIARVRQNNARHRHSKRDRVTLIDRLITDLDVPEKQVRATIVGLATAFVPTNTLAAGNMIEVLLDDTAMLSKARKAACDDDAAAMRKILLEAGRLNPALAPGLWRHVPGDRAPQPIGTGWRRRRTRPGDLVMAFLPSALRDMRGIVDDETRNRRNWMMFGFGPHDCWGAELALAHLVPVFMALLRQPGLCCAAGRDGTMLRVGPYPVRLDMTYQSPRSKRAMILATLPVRADVPRKTVETAIDALGNPASEEVAKTLRQGDRVQFASLSVIERAPGSSLSILVLEVSGDGDERELLGMIAEQCFAWLAPVVGFCADVPTPQALAAVLRRAYFEIDQRPFGKTGLHFDGMSELSVADIARQQRVAAFARKQVTRSLKWELGLNTRAMGMLLHTRRLMRGDSWLALRRQNRIMSRVAERIGVRGAPLRPSRKRLQIADWSPPTSVLQPVLAALKARDNRWIPVGAALVWLAWIAGLLAWWQPGTSGGEWALAIASAIGAGLILALATLIVPFATLALWLRWQESRDAIDEGAAPLDHVEAIARREDAPGQAQNHIIAVMPFKPGLLRKLTFAFAMWSIRQLVSFFFRPGFVVTMGTIHKARWFRVPGTEQFVFLSNYDGSWESYLEDFITRAHPGQTAAWTHGLGFPPTRFLFWDGAMDGDRFKRWVRMQQRESRFWFSRFPDLTAQQIRNNAMIEDGLARATSDTDARRWLACFGSAQREEDELESQEAQSVLFSGLSSTTESTALLLRLPGTAQDAGKWLRTVCGLKEYVQDTKTWVSFLTEKHPWLHLDEERLSFIRLSPQARVLFGDRSQVQGGAMLGFTAEGLRRCGFDQRNGFDSLPSAFRMTMAGRARLIGDDAETLGSWRFTDDADEANGAHALLTIYGSEERLPHAAMVESHIQLLAKFGGSIVHRIDCRPANGPDGEPSMDYEPFGFRDGISQPVIKGTRRSAKPVPERDLVAAGEFILGYRNHQGYLSPPIVVGAEQDPACELPTFGSARPNRYPWFGNREGHIEPRDFGRNGSFLAVRQLDQEVAEFRKYTADISERIRDQYKSLPELAGAEVDDEWVAAKMIGRWRDGRSLVGNPQKAKVPSPEENVPSPEETAEIGNDFAYGIDDPRGLACPLGAHIRRTNPRDSQEPADGDEQRITNRHRLLRRGRAYCYRPDGENGGEKTGLLFMALCADLERQFEFVQRTWINGTSFHGLVNERDPLMGQAESGARQKEGVFTIPTAAGPIKVDNLQSFVETRGGGYFFLPSRSAMQHLVTRSMR